MLYDPGMILLNPIILLYLTQGDEVYGAEESDTGNIIEEIRTKMESAGVRQITEISYGGGNGQEPADTEKARAGYKKALGELLSEKACVISRKEAEKRIRESEDAEKTALIEKETQSLQKKINAIRRAKADASSEEILKAIQSGRASLPLDVLERKDAAAAGFSEAEYESLMEKSSQLDGEKRKNFARACAVLSSDWEEYKSCGRSREECVENIFAYIKDGTESDFNYELTLSQILEGKGGSKERGTEINKNHITSFIEECLPQENRASAQEYIESLPEQEPAAEYAVYCSLSHAIKNYLAIRMSCGLSIRELFDYAVKSAGGKLPKESYRPVTGYVSRNAGRQTETDTTGSRRIFFEGRTSGLFGELMKKNGPQKEVPLRKLIESYEKEQAKKQRKTVRIGFPADKENEMLYDTGDYGGIRAVVLALVKKLRVSEKESRKRIIEIAGESRSREDFIRSLGKEYKVEYELSDKESREIYARESGISEEVLSDYADEFAQDAEKTLLGVNRAEKAGMTVEPVMRQLSVEEIQYTLAGNAALSESYRLQTHKTVRGGGLEKTRRVPLKTIEEKLVSKKERQAQKEERRPEDDENTVKILMENLTESERTEILHSTGEDWTQITPLLIKEYLWRKQNGRKTSNIARDVQGYERLAQLPHEELERFLTSSTVNGRSKTVWFDNKTMTFGGSKTEATVFSALPKTYIPVVKLSPEEKSHFLHDYGIRAEGLSPIVKEYIISGEWKNAAGNGRNYDDQIRAHFHTKNIGQTVKIEENAEKKLADSGTDILSGVKKADTAVISESLRNSLTRLAQGRNPRNPETMTKMERINANYEHDKAVLAKTDPLFAKDKMWDVGHAEGSGDRQKEIKVARKKIGKHIISGIEGI